MGSMSSEVTFEEAQRQIGQLPSVGPCSNVTNIRNLEVALFDSLEGIPPQQSHEYGYKGMAQQLEEYALISMSLGYHSRIQETIASSIQP